MKKFAIIAAVIVVAIAGYAFVIKGRSTASGIVYKYSEVKKGTVEESLAATGALKALTSVDVKSKAGGEIIKLAVDEGSVVKKGQLIALIDPRDTNATYRQAQASLVASEANVARSEKTYQLQIQDDNANVANAKKQLQLAELKLQSAKLQASRQPELTNASIATAEAAYNAGLEGLTKLQLVTIPQEEHDSAASVQQTKTSLASAQAELQRSKKLYALGYVSKSQVDTDEAAAAQAQSAYITAIQKEKTLPQDTQTSLMAQKAQVAQLKAALNQAEAQRSDIQISESALNQAQNDVAQAQIAYQKAIDDRLNDKIQEENVRSAQANTVGNQVAVDNAKVQLDSTTVVAPRDGVVTIKYLEEGTIIPPGESVYSQGTSIVQISDISSIYVDCQVDEADIAKVKLNEPVKIITEAYKDTPINGYVSLISPAATTTNNVTSVEVRVKINTSDLYKITLRPGMNASCNFILRHKDNVLYVPSQAINQDAQGTYVLVKSADPQKPTKKYVKVGITGDDNVEIVSGLNEGDQVVTAQIDMAKDAAIQKKMEQKGQGGLAGG